MSTNICPGALNAFLTIDLFVELQQWVKPWEEYKEKEKEWFGDYEKWREQISSLDFSSFARNLIESIG